MASYRVLLSNGRPATVKVTEPSWLAEGALQVETLVASISLPPMMVEALRKHFAKEAKEAEKQA